ncbi:MAG: cyclic pyranopterin monophosphate synthase MoaC [Defluviitaleaceae bacterium]|nr:cyclic pyranopterin monophosphate synthase MoaC [Defluviitaleaceae bacterium]
MSGFTHFDGEGNAIMVDVSEKAKTARQATASGKIYMSEACFGAVKGGGIKKGDVLGIARTAGIMAVKQTAFIIPLCHPIPVEKAIIDFELDEEKREITVYCTVKTTDKTGVEMEALTGASAALLTIFDMCKAVDKGMKIGEIVLEEKSGGKSGHYRRCNAND